MARASLKDVAARAGVSFQTASKVLSGKGTVAPTTRRRIQEAAADLGYVPNALARSLLSDSTLTIGVMTADFSDTTLAQPIVGIEQVAQRSGLCVIIGSLDESGSDWERYLRVLMERRVDGIILNTPATETNPRVRDVLRNVVPAVSLHHVAGDEVSRVSADDYGAGLLAARHLASLGHRRIGMVTGVSERKVTQLRAAAYQQALNEAGISYSPQLVEEGHWTVEGGYQAMHRLLDRAPDLSAVYVQNDMMAVGVLGALHDRGRRVPTDCAVVGCDDLPVASRTIPPLTTVRIPFYKIGEAAAGLLIRLMAERSLETRHETLPVELIYRAST